MASVYSTQVQVALRSNSDAGELTQPQVVSTEHCDEFDDDNIHNSRVSLGGARQSASMHENAAPGSHVSVDAGIQAVSHTNTTMSAMQMTVEDDWSPTRVSYAHQEEGSADGGPSILDQHSSSSSKKKRKNSSKSKRKRQSEAKDASSSEKQSGIKMLASNGKFWQIEQKYGAKIRGQAIKWLYKQIKQIRITDLEELAKHRHACILLKQVEDEDHPRGKRARKRTRYHKSKSKSKSKNTSKKKGIDKRSNSVTSASKLNNDRITNERASNLRADEVEWPDWGQTFRHDTRPFEPQQPPIKEADKVTLFPAAYARLMAELRRRVGAAKEHAQLTDDTKAVRHAQDVLGALSAMNLPAHLASCPFINCTVSKLSALVVPLADAQQTHDSSDDTTAADDHGGLGSDLELLQVELTEIDDHVTATDRSRNANVSDANGCSSNELSIRVIFQREEAQIMNPHLLLASHVRSSVAACIKCLQPGAPVKMQFEHPCNPSVGMWFRGRVYDMLCADHMSLDPFESIKVVWYDEECVTRQLSLRYEQTDNEVSPWDLVPDENVKVASTDTDNLIARTFSPSSTATDVVNFVRKERHCEAAIVFNEPLPKKHSPDGSLYHAQINNPIYLGDIRRSCMAGQYNGAAGMSLLWSQLEQMTANAKCFNQREVAPWRAADMMETIIRKIRTAMEKSKSDVKEFNVSPVMTTTDCRESDCESNATIRAD